MVMAAQNMSLKQFNYITVFEIKDMMILYAIWEQNDFAFSYVFTGNGDADMETLIQQYK